MPSPSDKALVVRDMFDRIAPRYELVNRVLTFSLDRSWRRLAVASLALPRGSLVLDLASGTGDLCRELEAHGDRAVGIDISWGMLKESRSNGPVLQGDAETLPFPDGCLDGITCGFALRNFVSSERVILEASRTMRSGGRIAILEVDTPSSPFLRAGHAIWFRHAVPLLGGLLSDRAAYGYLPRSVSYLPSSRELTDLLERAGFGEVSRRPLSGGVAQLVTATRGWVRTVSPLSSVLSPDKVG